MRNNQGLLCRFILFIQHTAQGSASGRGDRNDKRISLDDLKCFRKGIFYCGWMEDWR